MQSESKTTALLDEAISLCRRAINLAITYESQVENTRSKDEKECSAISNELRILMTERKVIKP